MLDLGDLFVTTADAPEGTGEVGGSLTFATLGLSYARYLTEAISFGATASYISEKVLSTASGCAFDLGLHYDSGWKNARFGLVMKNVGPNMRFSGSDFDYTLRLPGDDPQAANRTVSSLTADFELPSYFEMGARSGPGSRGNHASRPTRRSRATTSPGTSTGAGWNTPTRISS